MKDDGDMRERALDYHYLLLVVLHFWALLAASTGENGFSQRIKKYLVMLLAMIFSKWLGHLHFFAGLGGIANGGLRQSRCQ